MLQIANEPRFSELAPERIVPMLADERIYIVRESSFSCVLRLIADAAPGSVQDTAAQAAADYLRGDWPATTVVLDLTFLRAKVVGQWFYLYLILDVYTRKIVGFGVHETDSSDHAVDLLRRTALAEGINALPKKPVSPVTQKSPFAVIEDSSPLPEWSEGARQMGNSV